MSTRAYGWRIEIINNYRNLFHPPARAPILARGYPECGSGWREIIERACHRINLLLSSKERVEILQIKEKNGTMRLYWRGQLSERTWVAVEQIVALAQARSSTTCEQCGEEGRLYRASDALSTRCSTHAKGNPVQYKAGFENVHLVRRQAEGRPGIACCCYDRATDAFADLDLRVIGLDGK